MSKTLRLGRDVLTYSRLECLPAPDGTMSLVGYDPDHRELWRMSATRKELGIEPAGDEVRIMPSRSPIQTPAPSVLVFDVRAAFPNRDAARLALDVFLVGAAYEAGYHQYARAGRLLGMKRWLFRERCVTYFGDRRKKTAEGARDA